MDRAQMFLPTRRAARRPGKWSRASTGPARSRRKFAASNLGLRRNVSEGLDWVFAQTEEAIILEDDCLPEPSFFPFCDELLERYREDATVGMICGTNLAPRRDHRG